MGLPTIEQVQESLIANKRATISEGLLKHGFGSLYTRGLTEESIKLLIDECATQGYEVWERKEKENLAGLNEFEVVVDSSREDYLRNRFKRVK